MRVWFWLVYKFAENYSRSWFFSEFIQTQMRYSTSLDKRPILTWRLLDILIKLKFFLWTKLQENLLLAKYLISVSAPLSNGVCIPFRGSHSFQWKPLYGVRHDTHWTNRKVNLLIVYTWPLSAVIKGGFLKIFFINMKNDAQV